MKSTALHTLRLAALLGSIPALHAASGTWNTTASGNWSDSTKWIDNIVADGSGFIATFQAPTPNTSSPVVTITLDSDRTIGGLFFNGPNAGGVGTHNFTLSGPGVLTLAGSTTPTVTGGLTSRTATVSVSLAGTQGVTFENSGTVSNTTLIIAGNNTYTGETTIAGNNRIVTIAHNNALGSTNGGTTVSSNSALLLANGITVTGETLNLSSSGASSEGALRVATGGSAEWAGAINITGNSRITAGSTGSTIGTGGNLKVSGVIAGSGNLQVSGLGTLTLSGANTYTGTTQVFRGTLKLDAGNNRLPTATALTIGGSSESATLDLNGYHQQVARLVSGSGSGARILTNTGSAASTFTVNQTSGTDTFDGVIAGNINFVKSGAGTLNLTGTANTFTGNITINAGTLGIASAFINNTADVSIANGAVFALNFVGTDTISGLWLAGVAQQLGTYGAIGSGAQFQSAFFSGTGLLEVTSVIPEPSSAAAAAGLAALGLVGLRRRRR